MIRRGFQPLIDADSRDREVMAEGHAAVASSTALTGGPYQIVHFIGHGVYDEERVGLPGVRQRSRRRIHHRRTLSPRDLLPAGTQPRVPERLRERPRGPRRFQ